jgi:tRNA(Ile)-lysidine synthase
VVAAAARRLGADFVAHAVTVETGPNVEARARAVRYGVLPAGVMTGHTADDQAETVLLNVLRGAGLDGLRGMVDTPRVRRPLLGLRRSETRALCAATGLAPVDDPSNEDLALRRNQVRHRLLPLVAEISDRDPVPVLVRQGRLLADDAQLLDELAGALDPTDARALAASPAPLARRALRAWLRVGADDESHPPSAAEVARVLDVAAGGAVACEIAGGRRVCRSGGRLSIERQ